MRKYLWIAAIFLGLGLSASGSFASCGCQKPPAPREVLPTVRDFGNPIVIPAYDDTKVYKNLKLRIDTKGVVWVPLEGLGDICSSMSMRFNLRRAKFTVNDILVLNTDGHFLEILPNAGNHFSLQPTRLKYWRHSFEQYCQTHEKPEMALIGDGTRHADGTPHTDYGIVWAGLDVNWHGKPDTEWTVVTMMVRVKIGK